MEKMFETEPYKARGCDKKRDGYSMINHKKFPFRI